MSIRIPCWSEPLKSLQIPKYNSLDHILMWDYFYKGKMVQNLLIDDLAQKNNLDIEKIKESIFKVQLANGAAVECHRVLGDLGRTILLIVCFIGSGLKCYERDPLEMFTGEYYESTIQYLDVDLNDLRNFLSSNKLPLPYDLFQDESGNSSLFKNRLHNKKGFKETLSIGEIQELTIQHKKELIESKNADLSDSAEAGEDFLVKKYTDIVIEYCKSFIANGEQPASREETESFLSKKLKENNENIGKESRLPERSFRDIWRAVPKDFKRKTGVTTKQRAK